MSNPDDLTEEWPGTSVDELKEDLKDDWTKEQIPRSFWNSSPGSDDEAKRNDYWANLQGPSDEQKRDSFWTGLEGPSDEQKRDSFWGEVEGPSDEQKRINYLKSLIPSAVWDKLSGTDDQRLSRWWWEPQNQNATSACLGWALGDSVLRWHFRKERLIRPADRLSVRYIWQVAKEIGKNRGDDFETFRPRTFIEMAGSYMRDALDVGRKFGVVLAEELPFAGAGSTSSSVYAFYAKAARLKILSYYNLGINSNSVDYWKSWLKHQGPIFVLLNIDTSFNTLTSSNGGVLDTYQPPDNWSGHAVAVVGYDTSKKNYIIRNQWGTGWGMNGYAYASEQYLFAQWQQNGWVDRAAREAYGVVVGGVKAATLYGFQSFGT